MANVDQNDEPSMEDILASIRKIISDDEPAGAKAAPPKNDLDMEMDMGGDESVASADDIDAMFSDAAADMGGAEEEAAEEEEEGDVFQLTSDMALDEEGDVVFADPEPDAEEIPAFSEEVEMEADSFDMSDEDDFDTDSLDMEDTDGMADVLAPQAAAAFMNGAAGASLLSSGAQASVASAFGNLAHTILSKDARTLEDLVKEMLKPMLKGWLDENLPTMVERLVREEIERVSRGGR